MTHFCFTGPRKISYEQGIKIEKTLAEIMTKNWGEDWHTYHVGCAAGTDAVVRCYLVGVNYWPTIYRAEGKQPWQLAARSKQMVDGCYAQGNAKLIAFPNKPCPKGVKPAKTFSGKGSGTWGTIAYAYHLGLDVELEWLEPGLTEPDWMKTKTEQLTLF